MMAMADVQQLTEDELRAKLYSSLQKKGILDSLKSQLRNSLARELRSSLSVEPHVPRPSLYHQISNYLITDYLQENGLEYTLSTYLPEAGVHLDKLLSVEEVCNILGYHPPQIKTVSKKNKNASGLLLQLLQDLPNLLNKPLPAAISCSVQTESEDQLTVRKKHEENEDSDDEQNIERRMLAFQRDCESRNKRMLELEMARFKEKELSLMRLDERNRYLKDLTETKEQLKKQYQERLTSANKTIEEEKERLLRRERELEEGLFTQRQALLDEMESLKMREIELKRQSEIDKRSVVLEKDKTMSIQELLTSKEQLLDDLKQQYEQMAEAKLERYKAELETKKLTETQQIEQLKIQLEGSQESMRGLQSKFDKTAGDLQEERERVKELYEQLHSSMNRQNELVKERENLQIKLETVVDYPILQGRVREMELQLETVRRQHEGERGQLKNKIAEQQVIIKELKNKVGKSSRQQVTTQQQLEEQLEDTKKKTMSLQNNNRLLKQENNKKLEMNKQLQHRLDQVMIELHSAHNEIQDLQEQIDDLHNILAAGGSVTEKTKIKKKHSPRRRPKPVSLSTPPSNNSPLPPLLLNPIVHSPSTPNNISFSDSSAQLLAEARATFARMEREAEELTKTYNIFEPLSSTLLPSNDPIIIETSHHLEEPMTLFTMPTGVHPTLTYTDPILSVGHAHLSGSNVPSSVSNIPMTISTDTMATKQITSITSLSSNPTQTTSIVGSSSEKDPVVTIVTTKNISQTTATSTITSSSSIPLSLDNLWKTAAVTSQSTITVTTVHTPLVTTLSPSVSSSNPLTLDKTATVTSQTTAIPIPTSLNIQQEDRSSITTTSSNVVEILSSYSERVADSSKPAGTSVIIPPKLDDLWKPSPHVVSSQVTSSIPPQSLSSTLSFSKLEAKMSDNNDEWERERERKLQLRQEQERKEQEKVQQELAKLQQEQSDEDKPMYNEDSNHDLSSHPGDGTVEDDNTNDHKESNWSIQQYLASIQCQSPPPGSLQYKDPSTPSDQVRTYYRRCYKERFDDEFVKTLEWCHVCDYCVIKTIWIRTSNNLQVLSGPIDCLVSSGEGDSDPFENW